MSFHLFCFFYWNKMKDIGEELCLAHHHLLWIILQAFTFAMIYSTGFKSCWALPVPEKIYFSNNGLFWLAKGVVLWITSSCFRQLLRAIISIDRCIHASEKHQLSCLSCKKCCWTSTSVDSSVDTYSIPGHIVQSLIRKPFAAILSDTGF